MSFIHFVDNLHDPPFNVKHTHLYFSIIQQYIHPLLLQIDHSKAKTPYQVIKFNSKMVDFLHP